jgi:hypothetical protein
MTLAIQCFAQNQFHPPLDPSLNLLLRVMLRSLLVKCRCLWLLKLELDSPLIQVSFSEYPYTFEIISAIVSYRIVVTSSVVLRAQTPDRRNSHTPLLEISPMAATSPSASQVARFPVPQTILSARTLGALETITSDLMAVC